ELYNEAGTGTRLAINVGSAANDPSAETIRSAFGKINTMMAELYPALGGSSPSSINVGSAVNDLAAETVSSAFTKVNSMMSELYGLMAGSLASYYVAKTGNDSNPGTSAQPFLTIGKGLTVLAAGDILEIGAGTYAERLLEDDFAATGT